MCCARASCQPIKTLFLPQIYSRIIQSPNSSAANLIYTRTLDPHLVHSVIALDYLSHTRASANANPYRMADEANNPSVIVYEPATQTMSIAKIRDLESSPIIIQQTPRFKNHVKIKTESSEAGPERLIALLDLSKLGSRATAMRACGNLRQIYVMVMPDPPKSQMVL